jgi:hypothetical protein
LEGPDALAVPMVKMYYEGSPISPRTPSHSPSCSADLSGERCDSLDLVAYAHAAAAASNSELWGQRCWRLWRWVLC